MGYGTYPKVAMRRRARAAMQGRGAVAPAGDALDTSLAALEAASKLVCAWFLPIADPDQYLTLNGANVEGWTAAYGTQKVDLAEVTNPPTWDATLFSNKGGVVFDGANDCLTGTGNVSNWPADTEDLYMLAAVRNDSAANVGSKVVFSYGSGTITDSTGRSIYSSDGVTDVYAASRIGGIGAIGSGLGSFSGAHTIGVAVDIGGSSTPYLDGIGVAATPTAVASLTRTRVRLGSRPNNAGLFWQGAISCAAILNSTASLTDFTDLEALMRGRLT